MRQAMAGLRAVAAGCNEWNGRDGGGAAHARPSGSESMALFSIVGGERNARHGRRGMVVIVPPGAAGRQSLLGRRGKTMDHAGYTKV